LKFRRKRADRILLPITEREYITRNRSPWFSLGYLLATAIIVLVTILFVLWLA
jgi:hypothetical protein